MPAATTSGNTASVTCNRPSGGWPSGGFTVTAVVSASTAGVTDCDATKSAQTTLTKTNPPTVTVSVLSAPSTPVCASGSSVTTYTVTGGSPDLPVAVTATADNGVSCSRNPTSGRCRCNLQLPYTAEPQAGVRTQAILSISCIVRSTCCHVLINYCKRCASHCRHALGSCKKRVQTVSPSFQFSLAHGVLCPCTCGIIAKSDQLNGRLWEIEGMVDRQHASIKRNCPHQRHIACTAHNICSSPLVSIVVSHGTA